MTINEQKHKEFSSYVFQYLNKLLRNELKNHNRYNRVLICENADNAENSDEFLCALIQQIKLDPAVCQVIIDFNDFTQFPNDHQNGSSIFDVVSEAIGLNDEWNQVKRLKKLHQNEINLFETLLHQNNKKVFLILKSFDKVYQNNFDFQQSLKIQEDLALIVNSLEGLFFTIVSGPPILSNLLFDCLPQNHVKEFPNFTQRDMNITKLRPFYSN